MVPNIIAYGYYLSNCNGTNHRVEKPQCCVIQHCEEGAGSHLLKYIDDRWKERPRTSIYTIKEGTDTSWAGTEDLLRLPNGVELEQVGSSTATILKYHEKQPYEFTFNLLASGFMD